MGRKLTLADGESFTEDGMRSLDGERSVGSSSARRLQAQIAEALGLPVEALIWPSLPHSNHQKTAREAQAAEIMMSRDCSDLIQAYARITDPEERQRLLKIVRDAADGNP